MERPVLQIRCDSEGQVKELQRLLKDIKKALKTPKSIKFVKNSTITEMAYSALLEKKRGGRIW